MNLDGTYRIHVTPRDMDRLKEKFAEYKEIIGDNECFITCNKLGDLVFGWEQPLGNGSSSITYILV